MLSFRVPLRLHFGRVAQVRGLLQPVCLPGHLRWRAGYIPWFWGSMLVLVLSQVGHLHPISPERFQVASAQRFFFLLLRGLSGV